MMIVNIKARSIWLAKAALLPLLVMKPRDDVMSQSPKTAQR